MANQQSPATPQSQQSNEEPYVPLSILYMQPEEPDPLSSSWGEIQEHLRRYGVERLKEREALSN